MKIISSYRSDLLGITACASYWADETQPVGTPSDISFTATKLNEELVEFFVRCGRDTRSTFSWSLIRAALVEFKSPPEFISACATLSCPCICRD